MINKDVSIIIPLHNPDVDLLNKVLAKIKSQKFNGKIEIIPVDEGLGLASSLNYGINKAKNDNIVTLHQDCVPSSDEWLNKLVEILGTDEKIVASCSDVKDIEQQKVYTPLLDEKGCAYKLRALKQVGLFDEKTFLNSGEDMDMYMKLSKIGYIAYPHCTVEHYHPGYLTAKGYKQLQNANTWGCLFRRYGFSLKDWWKPFIKANIFNPGYFYWFWRGLILGKQDFKR